MNGKELEELFDRFLDDDIANEEADLIKTAVEKDPELLKRLIEHSVINSMLPLALDEQKQKSVFWTRLDKYIKSQEDGSHFTKEVIDKVKSSDRFHAYQQRKRKRMSRDRIGPGLWSWRVWVSVAACIFLVAGTVFYNHWKANKTLALVRAELLEVTPGVTVFRQDKAISVQAGMKILLNDMIRTDENAEAKIRYIDEATTIELEERTGIKVLEEKDAKRIDLVAGAIECDVQKQPEDKHMVIVTPHARVEVLGTRFTLAVVSGQLPATSGKKDEGHGIKKEKKEISPAIRNPQLAIGMTRLEVKEGTVKLTRTFDKKSTEVPAGYYAVVQKGTALMPVKIEKKVSTRKFIQTFLTYWNPSPRLVPGDEGALAKFDMIIMSRHGYNEINDDTWGTIKSINPDIEIYLRIYGIETWRSWNEKDKKPFHMDKEDVLYLHNIARYNNARGHSMGNLNRDNPDLFLLDKNGKRCNTCKEEYGENTRFLMDFGSKKYQKYWLEAVKTDIINRPWAADGVFVDNCVPFIKNFPADIPAKYDTDEKWSKAMIDFVNSITSGLHQYNMKVFTNSDGTKTEKGHEVLRALDNSPYPPDVIAEEGAFAVAWGGSDTHFIPEEKWKRQVDLLGMIRNSRIAYFSHTNVPAGESGTDNLEKPVTFWQTLWYSLCSYLLGKNDEQNNSYFSFEGSTLHRTFPWFDEYENIDLGKAIGKYKLTVHNRSNIYWREFEKGYVYVNPTPNDVTDIKLPETCKQLSHDNFKRNHSTIPDVKTIDLKSHRGTMLVKSN